MLHLQLIIQRLLLLLSSMATLNLKLSGRAANAQELQNFINKANQKTAAGKILHDVGATALKAVVQPFKSFSNTKKYDNIFNPKLQTKTFATLNKGIDKLDDLGHAVGQAYVGKKTGNAVAWDAKGNPSVDVKKLADVYGEKLLTKAADLTGLAGKSQSIGNGIIGSSIKGVDKIQLPSGMDSYGSVVDAPYVSGGSSQNLSVPNKNFFPTLNSVVNE